MKWRGLLADRSVRRMRVTFSHLLWVIEGLWNYKLSFPVCFFHSIFNQIQLTKNKNDHHLLILYISEPHTIQYMNIIMTIPWFYLNQKPLCVYSDLKLKKRDKKIKLCFTDKKGIIIITIIINHDHYYYLNDKKCTMIQSF